MNMNLTNDKVKLMEFAGKSQEDIFSKIDSECASYWQEVDSQEALMEKYEFETPMDLICELSKYIQSTDLCKIMTAASFKNQQVASNLKKEKTEEDAQLPEYVYNF
jgi:hypothetical protein